MTTDILPGWDTFCRKEIGPGETELNPLETGAPVNGSLQVCFVGKPTYSKAEALTIETALASYRALRKGGSIVVFVDLAHLSGAAKVLERSKFKQLRYVQAVSEEFSSFYPANNRMMAIVAVKQGGSTFNTHYHNGSFDGVGDEQADAKLMLSELVMIHSNANAVIATTSKTVSNLLSGLRTELRKQVEASEEEKAKYAAKKAKQLAQSASI